jgi:methylenetetrahydrofolate dehydrogenase (NADP+)/methenyltetrahydrofolate cyclohydrolase
VSARVVDGRAIAATARAEVARDVAALRKRGVIPGLATVLVGEDPGSKVYVTSKRKACAEAGIAAWDHDLPAGTTQAQLVELVDRLNSDVRVHGILVQLPLPEHIDADAVVDAVDPKKDADGFHPYNLGRLLSGRAGVVPATPAGIRELLVRSDITVAGAHAVIVGRSNIVGKPLAALLMQKGDGGNATVTVCHTGTRDLPEHTRRADILVAAIGRPSAITEPMVSPGATVVDVGVNRTQDGLTGDVDFDGVRRVASAITPVPGGVGPMTIAMLLRNVVALARAGAQQSLQS